MRSKFMIFGLLLASFAFTSCAKKNAEPATASDAEKQKSEQSAAADAKDGQDETASKTSSENATQAGVTIAEAVVCKKVEDRNPIEPGDTFSADVGRVYLFSQVSLDEGVATSIKHVWKFNGEEMASVTLPVRGPSWRTYSSKNILDFQKGGWSVDITTEEGDLIKSVAFNIQ